MPDDSFYAPDSQGAVQTVPARPAPMRIPPFAAEGLPPGFNITDNTPRLRPEDLKLPDGSHFTVIGVGDKRGFYVLKCVCGNVVKKRGSRVISGHSKSCGCMKASMCGAARKTHGGTAGGKSPEYRRWRGMIGRCYNKNAKKYPEYGGRGIKVCKWWRKDFLNFLADMGECPSDAHSIDRIDNDWHYIPGNCRWATALTQSRNTRHNFNISFGGRVQCLQAWAEELGVRRETLNWRIRHNGVKAAFARSMKKGAANA